MPYDVSYPTLLGGPRTPLFGLSRESQALNENSTEAGRTRRGSVPGAYTRTQSKIGIAWATRASLCSLEQKRCTIAAVPELTQDSAGPKGSGACDVMAVAFFPSLQPHDLRRNYA